jgi:KDO2-lipid IV(A) lauroyltransferase
MSEGINKPRLFYFWGYLALFLSFPFIYGKFARAMANLKQAFPEKGHLWRFFVAINSLAESLFSVLECFWIYKKLKRKFGSFLWVDELKSWDLIAGDSCFLRAVNNKDTPLVILSGHTSNFVGLILASLMSGREVGVFLKKVRNKRLEKIFFKIRNATGVEHLYIDERPSTMRAMKILKNKGIVIGLLDQHFGRDNRVETVFFGRKCFSAPGLFALANKAEADVVTAFTARDENRLKIVCYNGPAKVDGGKASLFEFVKNLEVHIRKYPGQWTWMHRRWKV